MQHAPINNSEHYRFLQIGVRNASEVVREVGINDFRVAMVQHCSHLDHCLLRVAPRTVGVLFWWKVGVRHG